MPKIPVSLYSIHLMLMLSPAMFAVVIYLINVPGETPASPADDLKVFQTVAAVLAVIAVGMAQLIPRFMFRGEERVPMRRYSSMKIVQWAMLEGAAGFMAVVFYLTQQKTILVPLGILIGLIAFLRPTVDEAQRFNVKE